MPPLALWMPYASLWMALAYGVALLGERLRQAAGRSTRFVWVAALLLSPLAALVASSRGGERALSSPPASSATAPAGVGARDGAPGAVEPFAVLATPPSVTVDRLERPLKLTWMAMSGGLLLVVALSLLRVWLRTAKAQVQQVDGVAVRVDEALGPAASPFMGGSVLVPSWLRALDPPLRELVLTHERQHLQAGDPVLLLIGMVVTALLPWSPAAWLILRRMRLAIELDCDARTLAACAGERDDQRIRYARLLVLAAQRIGEADRPVGSSVLFPAVSEHLARRLHMLTAPLVPVSRRRTIALAISMLGITTIALAIPRPQRQATSEQPAEIAGLYWMVPPNVPSTRMLAPGREFTYLRLAPDGRYRLENVTVDARGERVAPSVEVGPWGTEKWRVQPASDTTGPMLCWQLGGVGRMICSVFERDAASGDITLYRDAIGGKVELVLRRATQR
jgi:hypothetical protein